MAHFSDYHLYESYLYPYDENGHIKQVLKIGDGGGICIESFV